MTVDREGLLESFAQAGGGFRVVAFDHLGELFHPRHAFVGFPEPAGFPNGRFRGTIHPATLVGT